VRHCGGSARPLQNFSENVGLDDGSFVGPADGATVGLTLGDAEVGADVGFAVGLAVGLIVGPAVGLSVSGQYVACEMIAMAVSTPSPADNSSASRMA